VLAVVWVLLGCLKYSSFFFGFGEVGWFGWPLCSQLGVSFFALPQLEFEKLVQAAQIEILVFTGQYKNE
jgi:hypothetical protein